MFKLYLILQLDTIVGLITTGLIFVVIGFVVVNIYLLGAVVYDYAKENIASAKLLSKKMLYMLILMIVLTIITPTTKQAITIVVGNELLQSKKISILSTKTTDLVVEIVDKKLKEFKHIGLK